jgi:MraZ protein
MFIGEYSHNLDEKGRLAIPKKFRTQLKTGAVITRGLDDCLFLYTASEWDVLAKKLAELPFSKANTRAFARLMLAGAMDVALDKQGRVVVPDYLRRYANLEKEVVVAGLYNRLELWSLHQWRAYSAQTELARNEIAEQLGELGI